jgi:hypothetical protein
VTRREFMSLLGGAAAAWPLAARAQQAERMRKIGVLMGVANDSEGQARIAAFQQALQALGWTEGENVQVDIRWTEGISPGHAVDLLSRSNGRCCPRVCGGWRPCQLRSEPGRRVSAGGRLRRANSQGRQTVQPAGVATNHIRAGDQSESRQGARDRSAADAARPRRRGDGMKRRQFITLLGGAAAAWPLAARAQQMALPKVGGAQQR